MTQESAGKAFGVSQRAVCGWLNGSIPRPNMLNKIAEKFRIDLEVLTDDTKELPPEYSIYKNLSAAEFDKLEKYLQFFEYLPKSKLKEAIDLAMTNGDSDVVKVLVHRMIDKGTNDKA